MLPWKLRKCHILPVNQNLSSMYFSLAKFQLVSCNLSLAMIWQIIYTHKLPRLCSATLRRRSTRMTNYQRAWTIVILAGKRNSRPWSFYYEFSENVVVAKTSYQVKEVLWFCHRDRVLTPSIKITVLTILVKKKIQWHFPWSLFF